MVKKYFTKENRAVATYTRKAGAAKDEDPDLIGLSAEQKPIVHRVVASLQAETDVAKLKDTATKMEAQTAGGDPKRQQIQKIILKKVQERIAELEKK